MRINQPNFTLVVTVTGQTNPSGRLEVTIQESINKCYTLQANELSIILATVDNKRID